MPVSISLVINGEERVIALDDARVTLLDLLRERLGLTGAKKGCDRGAVRRLHRACRRAPRQFMPRAGGGP